MNYKYTHEKEKVNNIIQRHVVQYIDIVGIKGKCSRQRRCLRPQQSDLVLK